MWGRAFAFAWVTGSLLGCGDPAPTSPAALAGEVMLASRAELSATPPVETAAPSAVVVADVSKSLQGRAPDEPPPPEEMVVPNASPTPLEAPPSQARRWVEPVPVEPELQSFDEWQGNTTDPKRVTRPDAIVEEGAPGGVTGPRISDRATPVAGESVAVGPRTIAGVALAEATVTDLEKALRRAGCDAITRIDSPDAAGKQHAVLSATCGDSEVTVTFVPKEGLPLDEASKAAIVKDGASFAIGGAFLGVVTADKKPASARALLNRIARR
jgi:hypothetical protein